MQAAKDENKVVVIKFFASWCRACKAMAPKISRVAEDWPDIEFYEIMFDDNKKLCKSLGIKILPFVEIVAGTAGKVESFSCGPSKISQLQARARALAARPHTPPPSPRPLTARSAAGVHVRAWPLLPEELHVDARDGVVPDRGRVQRGRARRIHLGHLHRRGHGRYGGVQLQCRPLPH